ncbi:unnamed protein product [Leptosia nina]|uniref:Protein phosphatase 1 regulatory subunit 15A/B C-terminal domain-containing protein n=1 Tax=Leptosia nina TaxID=320188 RepID=A0AAV1JBQ4_9NEOP
MQNALGDTLLLNNIHNLHLIPDPLKKNLADSVITGTMEQRKEPDKFEKPAPRPETGTLGGISNFISGVFNVMSAIFQKRSPSPTSQYYDCFDTLDDGQMSPSLAWLPAKFEVQNKNSPEPNNMDTKSVVTRCDNKPNEVHVFLNGSLPYYTKAPKTIHEHASVDESFEDAFCPENIVRTANDTLINFYGACKHEEPKLFEADAPIVKTELKESMDIVKNLPSVSENETKTCQTDSTNEKKHEVVTSCEDKINKIKELLQSKRRNTKPSKEGSAPIEIKEIIPESFAHEINSNDSETVEHSFDEVRGRFYSSSTDSDDSFQIVFTDRKRIPSDCESEDSFIVFEETPECYTTNEVFGYDSDDECDSGYYMTCLNHSLSRTIGDLTDDSLYSQDVVDFARETADSGDTGIDTEETDTQEETSSGLLLDEKKKKEKKLKPAKRVHFSTDPPKVHVMRVWAFAARQARAGHWERHALDRERFRRRIADVEMAISWVLKPQHRSRVMFQRFMPWWNAQKRKEAAEKKALEEKQKEIDGEKNRLNKEEESPKINKASLKEIQSEDKTEDIQVDCNNVVEDITEQVDKVEKSLNKLKIKEKKDLTFSGDEEDKASVDNGSKEMSEDRKKDNLIQVKNRNGCVKNVALNRAKGKKLKKSSSDT